MTEEELQAALEKTTPQRERYELFVEECQDENVRVRFSPAKGPGDDGRWTMPALLAVAQVSLRAAAGVDTRVTHLNVTTIRSAQQADVLALARVIRRDGVTVHAECWLFSHAVVEPMLHATATLST